MAYVISYNISVSDRMSNLFRICHHYQLREFRNNFIGRSRFLHITSTCQLLVPLVPLCSRNIDLGPTFFEFEQSSLLRYLKIFRDEQRIMYNTKSVIHHVPYSQLKNSNTSEAVQIRVFF